MIEEFSDANNSETDRRELHEVLFEFADRDEEKPLQQPPIFAKLTLEIKEAARLLLLLRELGVSANQIYDGFAGSAEAVEETAKIKRFLAN